MSLRLPRERELSELRKELNQEQQDISLAAAAKYQALAGFDPGSASDDWLRAAEALEVESGIAIADAAEHFQVSEQVVLNTLVNKGKLPRSRLQT